MDAGRAQPYCLNPLLVARLRVSAAEDVHRTLLQGSTEPQGSVPCSLKIGLAAVNQKEIHPIQNTLDR